MQDQDSPCVWEAAVIAWLGSIFLVILGWITIPVTSCPLACQRVLRLRVLPHEEFKVLLETVAVGFVLSWMHRVF